MLKKSDDDTAPPMITECEAITKFPTQSIPWAQHPGIYSFGNMHFLSSSSVVKPPSPEDAKSPENEAVGYFWQQWLI